MGGKKSQHKGAAGERELATILQEYGYDCNRGFGKLQLTTFLRAHGLPPFDEKI